MSEKYCVSFRIQEWLRMSRNCPKKKIKDVGKIWLKKIRTSKKEKKLK